jgi:hypothetical protein
MFISAHYFNKQQTISLRVCAVSQCRLHFAIADMTDMHKRNNFSKPKVFTKSELALLVEKEKLERASFVLPAEMTFTDETLIKKSRETWLNKRDAKWARIASLTDDNVVDEYLFGSGIGSEIEHLKSIQDDPWKTNGAYYNALNRYIVLGQTKNALLPFGLKNTGSNYLEFDKASDEVVKRGRGGKLNLLSLSKSRGITKKDKYNIKRVVAYFKKEGRKLSFKQAFFMYQEKFETHVISRLDFIGDKISTYVPFNATEILSYSQFYYHAKRSHSMSDLLKIKIGNLGYEKDLKSRQGKAWEGVMGATGRYEVDATVLDVYIRYPYDLEGRYSMGRPVLYLVLDVYSTMVVGMHLSFSGPNWEGAAAALVNACSDKVAFAKKYGLTITDSDWPARHIPQEISIDNGNEFPNSMIESTLLNELGVKAVNLAAVYRGDAKGTVEGTFNALNNESIHFMAGAIFEDKREDQHSSNAAFYDYDALMAELIQHFIYTNKSANRAKRYNWQSARDGIDITPQALYLNSLKQTMYGGRPSLPDEEGKLWWAFLPEKIATVRDTSLYFNGLHYYSAYAANQGWYDKAKFEGRFQIPVKMLKNTTSSIWHKTDDGKYIEFNLQNFNNESAYIDEPWEVVEHLLKALKIKGHDLKDANRYLRAEKRTNMAQINARMQAQLDLSKPNERKSMQPNIKERQAVQREINAQGMSKEVSKKLTKQQQIEADTQEEYADLTNLYD